MKFLLDQSFLVYRANQLPIFTAFHRERAAFLVASYVYTKYTSTTTDVIPKYRSEDDVDVTANSHILETTDLNFSYMTIDAPSSTHLFIFMKAGDEVIVLIQSSMAVFLVQMMESLDFSTPLILHPLRITSKLITKLINGLHPLTLEDSSILGEINLAFAPPIKLSSDHLKQILVTVPRDDSKRLFRDLQDPPMNVICAWLEKATTLKFHNLSLRSVACDVLTVTTSKLKISGLLLHEHAINSILIAICETFLMQS